MTIHHLNCCTMTPPSPRLINGRGSWFGRGHMVAHVLLIESSDGLVLVDAGLGLADCAHPKERLGAVFVSVVSPLLEPAETAIRQVEALGYDARDVRHIVCTHLDVDHAGGLSDFPDATVHVYAAEHRAAMKPKTFMEKERYKKAHFAHQPSWQLHEVDGESFKGLSAVRAIVEPDILLVPTTGHSRGHAAVAVETAEGWLLHAGDAYFNKGEMNEPPTCPAGVLRFQQVAAISERARLQNQAKLRQLRQDNRDVRVFSAHDPDELAAF